MRNYRIVVTGVVQGVGFRPFIYQLARKWGLVGDVLNSPAGVIIQVEGETGALEGFIREMQDNKPSLAVLNDYSYTEMPLVGYTRFTILDSDKTINSKEAGMLIPPDVAVCSQCSQEVLDQEDRRYRYPFTNCTNCGPRYTIIKGLPYDRPLTTMAVFPMCADCTKEYGNPEDRRFHAQPVACPECGPQVEVVDKAGQPVNRQEHWLELSRSLLKAGNILAVKGLGGFHLLCDAYSTAAVNLLRERKGRKHKPFAVMCRDITTVNKHCVASDKEQALLTSQAAPIVILPKRTKEPGAGILPEGKSLAEGVAPSVDTLGVMLPYTPLHLLLLSGDMDTLVATSGNYSHLPLVIDNDRALKELAGIADFFLLHNRGIVNRCDDSLVRVIDGERHFYRRSRGYVPAPVTVARPVESPVILGIGGEMKNNFCLLTGNQGFMSTYIGEIDSVEGEENLRQEVEHMRRLLGVTPELVAYDSHPGYNSAGLAQRIPARAYYPVQHHHSHLASCMAENGLGNQRVIGAILDGTGYGPDGKLWGFEILAGDYVDFERHWHLQYIPLPGGEAAIRQPWRSAASYLITLLGREGKEQANRLFPNKNIEVIEKMIHNDLNAPESSGCGRLFDAVAAILGICLENSYEGQGATELAAVLPLPAQGDSGHPTGWQPYPFELADGLIRPQKTLEAILEDQKRQVTLPQIALRFHQTLVEMVGQTTEAAARAAGCQQIVLSGGTWQNPYLLSQTKKYLQARGYRVYYHRQVPTNDGGLGIGQAMIAYWRWRKECV